MGSSDENRLRPHRPRSSTSTTFGLSIVGDLDLRSEAPITKTSRNAILAAEAAYCRLNQPGRPHTMRGVRGHRSMASLHSTTRPLTRQQSIRFMGPRAVMPRSRPITERSIELFDTPSASEPVPQSRSSSLAEADPQGFAPGALYGSFAPSLASEPSSYRRVRRSRSMPIFNSRTRHGENLERGVPGQHLRRRSMRSLQGSASDGRTYLARANLFNTIAKARHWVRKRQKQTFSNAGRQPGPVAGPAVSHAGFDVRDLTLERSLQSSSGLRRRITNMQGRLLQKVTTVFGSTRRSKPANPAYGDFYPGNPRNSQEVDIRTSQYSKAYETSLNTPQGSSAGQAATHSLSRKPPRFSFETSYADEKATESRLTSWTDSSLLGGHADVDAQQEKFRLSSIEEDSPVKVWLQQPKDELATGLSPVTMPYSQEKESYTAPGHQGISAPLFGHSQVGVAHPQIQLSPALVEKKLSEMERSCASLRIVMSNSPLPHELHHTRQSVSRSSGSREPMASIQLNGDDFKALAEKRPTGIERSGLGQDVQSVAPFPTDSGEQKSPSHAQGQLASDALSESIYSTDTMSNGAEVPRMIARNRRLLASPEVDDETTSIFDSDASLTNLEPLNNSQTSRTLEDQEIRLSDDIALGKGHARENAELGEGKTASESISKEFASDTSDGLGYSQKTSASGKAWQKKELFVPTGSKRSVSPMHRSVAPSPESLTYESRVLSSGRGVATLSASTFASARSPLANFNGNNSRVAAKGHWKHSDQGSQKGSGDTQDQNMPHVVSSAYLRFENRVPYLADEAVFL